MVNDPNADWEKYGEEDSYFGVVSLDRFHKTHLTPEALTEFFESGRQHIEYVLRTLATHIDPTYRPRTALDFGCGVGRCTIPLAKSCERVTGVDVSQAMIEEARRNALAHSVHNIDWVHSDNLATLGGHFDLVHCFIVFQHIPPDKGMLLLSRLVDLLAIDGMASIQLLYRKNVSRLRQVLGRARVAVPLVHKLANLYYSRPFNDPLMQKNPYDLNAVFSLLQNKGCGSCLVRLAESGEHQDVVLFFRKRPDAIPYYLFYNSAQEARSV
jgi:SAM-dependent methyltransferase